MINTFSINKILIAGALLLIVLASCTKSDHFYKDYIIERTFVGKVDSVWINPGEGRMKLSWLNSKDLTAKNLIAYWNDNLDSAIIPIDHAVDTGTFILNNLDQGDYQFNIVTNDVKGNRSLPTELSTTIYGDTYRSTLLNQGIDHVVLFKDSVIVLWKKIQVEAELIGNEIEFTDKSNKKQVVFAPTNTVHSTIKNVDRTKPVFVRSLYNPDPLPLDEIYSNSQEYTLTDMQVNTLRLTSDSNWDNGEFIDFKLVKIYKANQIPAVQAQDIDLSHLRGGGSKHNFFTINSNSFGAFSSAYQASANAWAVRNVAKMVNIGNGDDERAIYDSLDEEDRAAMELAYQNAENNFGIGVDRLTQVKQGDIILLHSVDRDMYIAIKAAYVETDGVIDIEFKVSRE